MRYRRKWFWFWLGLGLVVLGLMSQLTPVQVEYHKWRLKAAKANSARLQTEGLSGMDELQAIVRRRPMSSDDYDHLAVKHGNALVRLGFLQRLEFRIESNDALLQRRLANTLSDMNANCEWWTYHVSTPSTNLIVIGCSGGLESWKEAAQGMPLSSGSMCLVQEHWYADTK